MGPPARGIPHVYITCRSMSAPFGHVGQMQQQHNVGGGRGPSSQSELGPSGLALLVPAFALKFQQLMATGHLQLGFSVYIYIYVYTYIATNASTRVHGYNILHFQPVKPVEAPPWPRRQACQRAKAVEVFLENGFHDVETHRHPMRRICSKRTKRRPTCQKAVEPILFSHQTGPDE